MALGNLEIRMAHLEGAYEQINHRLGAIEQDLLGLRAEVGGLRAEIGGLHGEFGGVRGEIGAVRRELVGRMDRQFFWMLGLLIISILLPIARSIGH